MSVWLLTFLSVILRAPAICLVWMSCHCQISLLFHQFLCLSVSLLFCLSFWKSLESVLSKCLVSIESRLLITSVFISVCHSECCCNPFCLNVLSRVNHYLVNYCICLSHYFLSTILNVPATCFVWMSCPSQISLFFLFFLSIISCLSHCFSGCHSESPYLFCLFLCFVNYWVSLLFCLSKFLSCLNVCAIVLSVSLLFKSVCYSECSFLQSVLSECQSNRMSLLPVSILSIIVSVRLITFLLSFRMFLQSVTFLSFWIAILSLSNQSFILSSHSEILSVILIESPAICLVWMSCPCQIICINQLLCLSVSLLFCLSFWMSL